MCKRIPVKEFIEIERKLLQAELALEKKIEKELEKDHKLRKKGKRVKGSWAEVMARGGRK